MAAGQNVSDDELILYTLSGLEAVVVNLTSRDLVTLQEFQYLLQTHEMRLEQLSAASMVTLPISEAHMARGQTTSIPTFEDHRPPFMAVPADGVEVAVASSQEVVLWKQTPLSDMR